MKKILLPLLILLIVSCQSDRSLLKESKSTSSSLMVKVFNGENRACPGVRITLTGEKAKEYEAESDITGKALIPQLPYGPYRVRMYREGFEEVAFDFDYSRADQSLYGRLYSLEQILEESRDAMEQRKWKDADDLLVRAEKIGSEPVLTAFYRAIWEWKTGKADKAIKRLEELRDGDEIIPKMVTVFLADLYQYDMNDNDKALALLEEMNKTYYDDELTERIELLKKEIENETE